jgi:hypothetical protein
MALKFCIRLKTLVPFPLWLVGETTMAVSYSTLFCRCCSLTAGFPFRKTVFNLIGVSNFMKAIGSYVAFFLIQAFGSQLAVVKVFLKFGIQFSDIVRSDLNGRKTRGFVVRHTI